MTNRRWPACAVVLLAMTAAAPAFAQAAVASASGDVRRVIDWVAESGDNGNLPFAIVDKVDARVLVFDAHGVLLGASPVLLGLARGDVATAGIGDRKLSTIRPEERVTPAGRFVASIGPNLTSKEVLWVDYASAVSMHRVVTSNPAEKRLQRLATETVADNRISFGCINVPVLFFDTVVKPSFSRDGRHRLCAARGEAARRRLRHDTRSRMIVQPAG